MKILTKDEQAAIDRQIELQVTIEEVRLTNDYSKLEPFFHSHYQLSTSTGFISSYDPLLIIKYAGNHTWFSDPFLYECKTLKNGLIRLQFEYRNREGKPMQMRFSYWKEEHGQLKQIEHYINFIEQ